jgi:hypothetical protein
MSEHLELIKRARRLAEMAQNANGLLAREVAEVLPKLIDLAVELDKEVIDSREKLFEHMLAWRGIQFPEDICEKCRGAGVTGYASTATWRGGIGGMAITTDVCDACWGTGSKLRTGLNLRKLSRILTDEQRKVLREDE